MTYRQMFKKLEAMPDKCLDAEVRILTIISIPANSEILPENIEQAKDEPFIAIIRESEITK